MRTDLSCKKPPKIEQKILNKIKFESSKVASETFDDCISQHLFENSNFQYQFNHSIVLGIKFALLEESKRLRSFNYNFCDKFAC